MISGHAGSKTTGIAVAPRSYIPMMRGGFGVGVEPQVREAVEQRRFRRPSRPGRRACPGRCGGRSRTPGSASPAGMSNSSGRSHRAGSRFAAPGTCAPPRPPGAATPPSSVSALTKRENIGSVGIHRSDSSIAVSAAVGRRARPRDVRTLKERRERDAHLLPRRPRAGAEQQEDERRSRDR